MKQRYFIAALLLVVAGVQMAFAQKVIIKLKDSQVLRYKVSDVEFISFEEAMNYESVDLGLPSGTLWAAYNVGATKAEEYGDYFAWAETSPQLSYSWFDYKYCNSRYNYLTRYNPLSEYGYEGFVDTLTILLPVDDAACYCWDDNWRIPSNSHFVELFNSTYTEQTWKTFNGVYGVEIRSKMNGNSIFLPATGRGAGMEAGTIGSYWMRDLNYYTPYEARAITIDDSSFSLTTFSRCYPLSIRAIRVDKADPILVSRITLDKQYLSVKSGESRQLTATVSPINARNRSLSWQSSNTNVATVSLGGYVSAVGGGNCTITCSATDGSGVKATCSVSVTQLVTSIRLNAVAMTLAVGTNYTLVPTVLPQNASSSVTWSSSNKNVATVNQSGNVTAVAKGRCTITCTAADGSGVQATCDVTVTQPVTSIKLSQSSLSMVVNGSSQTLVATVLPADASNPSVSWTSSNTSVATVSGSGRVTPVGRGSCTITCRATDNSGKSASCLVKVNSAPQYVNLGLPSGTLWATFNIGANSPSDYGDFFAWGETEPNKSSYTWSTYKFYSGGSGSSVRTTKYNGSNPILEASDDAATVIWGSQWQMPTPQQCNELLNGVYINKEWTTQNGVYGLKCTSRSNGNSIFLPATGYYSSSEHYYYGTSGDFWTNKLQESSGSYSTIFSVKFHVSEKSVNCYCSGESRFIGMPVRPVRK